MNSIQLSQPQLQDRFGRQVAARLAVGSAELPYDISERLRAARTQALTKRKRVAALRTASSVSASGGAATLTAGDEPLSWWNRVASVLPILALVAGLIVIHTIENERRASEVAEVDAALLTDDLPPSAYADSGFIQFLKQSGKE
jgi:hypothetical protein